jgi:hypothetical protein
MYYAYDMGLANKRHSFSRYKKYVTRRAALVGVIVVFALGGLYLLRESLAAGFSAAIETENGTAGGTASVLSDGEASGGQVVRFGASTHGNATFKEDFSAGTLGSGWTWSDPGGSASYQLSGGGFNLATPGGNDQWIGVDAAPRLLKNRPGGDWTVETRVTTNNTAGTIFGGLTIFADASNWLIWGQLGGGSLEASGLINNAPTQPISTMATQYNYLRIRKTGTSYYFDASADGRNWNNASVYHDTAGALNSARVGFMAKNWGAAGSAAIPMSFDYYREYGADLMPSMLANNVTTTQVAKETGYDSINATQPVGVCGTDLGVPFSWQNKVFFAFGDTKDPCNQFPHLSNVLSHSSDTNPADGISFDGWATDGSGKAKELFGEDAGGASAIPTGAVGVGNSAYIYYMNVQSWDPSPEPEQYKWKCTGSSIAMATADNIGTWSKQPAATWAGNSNFGMVAVWQQGDTLYIWGSPCGRMGSVKLMKVATSSVLNKSAYQYFSGYDPSGNPRWSSSEAAAATVAGGPVGEMSVMYNNWLDRYVMTYLDERKAALVIREAPNPWGPWTAPVQLAHGSQYPTLYGSYMNPRFVEGNGQTIYYLMSIFDPHYNVFLMKSTLQKR